MASGFEESGLGQAARSVGYVRVYTDADDVTRSEDLHIVLMEDTAGPGHGLTALTDLVMAVVRLEPVG